MTKCLVLFAVLVGCSAPQNTTENVGGKTRSMASLEDRVRASDLWNQWTPTTQFVRPVDFEKKTTAFDYWVVEDDRSKEEYWAVLFSVLDFFREDARLDENQRMSVESLMSGLEGTGSQLDMTFLVSQSDSDLWEGVLVRYGRSIVGGVGSSSVFLQRDVKRGAGFSRAWIWLQPGFEEPPTLTIFLQNSGNGWASSITEKTTWNRAVDADAADVSSVVQLFTVSFWANLTQSAYVENSPQTDVIGVLFAPAIGLNLSDRMIERVYSDTVFPPRLTKGFTLPK